MTLQIPDGFGQAVAQFDFTGGQSNPMAMVFGYANPEDINGPDAAQIIGDAIGAKFVSTLFTDQVIYQQLSVVQNPGSATGLATYGAAGGNSANATPPNTCLLVHKITTLGGRQGRGRMYWPSLSVGDVNEAGVIAGASLTGFQTGMSALLADLVSGFLPMYLLHTSPAVAPTFVTALVVDPVAATQRRRMRS